MKAEMTAQLVINALVLLFASIQTPTSIDSEPGQRNNVAL